MSQTDAKQFHKTRWLYKKDGRDVGPFRPHELEELMAKREISATTPVRDLTTADWKALGQIGAFGDIVARVETKQAHAEQDRKLDRQVAGERQKRTIPFIAFSVVLLGALGAGAYFGWQKYQTASAQVPSGIATDLIRQLELHALPERGYLNTAGPIQWAEEKGAVREAKAAAEKAAAAPVKPKRRPVASSGAPAEARAVGADDLAEEAAGEAEEFDFAAGGSAGRELEPGEVAMVRQTAGSRLVACAQAEAERNDGFPGTTVSFALLPSGKTGKIRLGKNGTASSAFSSCVQNALSGISVSPFAGTPQTFKVPLNVGR